MPLPVARNVGLHALPFVNLALGEVIWYEENE